MTLVSRYVRSAALRAVILVALALTSLFSLLEFVDQLASVGQGRYRLVDALVYVALTAPSRLVEVMPVSMLLGSLLALGPLSRNCELTVMLSLGISERRLVMSIASMTVPVVVALFLIAQFVVPPAQQLAEARRSAALSTTPFFHADDGLWVQDHHQYLNVRAFEPAGAPTGIDIYTFAADDSLESAVHADRATVQPDNVWRLANVTRRRIVDSQVRTEHLASLPWQSFLSVRQAKCLMLPLKSIPPVALYHYVRDLDRGHQTATRYSEELWSRLSVPVSMVGMIMIAAPFTFGAQRMQNTAKNVVYGVVIGIVFSLCQQILGRVGLLADISPAVTGLAPPLVLIALALYLRSPVNQRQW